MGEYYKLLRERPVLRFTFFSICDILKASVKSEGIFDLSECAG